LQGRGWGGDHNNESMESWAGEGAQCAYSGGGGAAAP